MPPALQRLHDLSQVCQQNLVIRNTVLVFDILLVVIWQVASGSTARLYRVPYRKQRGVLFWGEKRLPNGSKKIPSRFTCVLSRRDLAQALLKAVFNP